jgi:hypothetical protein
MATYVLQNSAQQIDQAVTAAYSGLVLGGTGLARTTGDQTIGGVKTFTNQAVFSSGAILGAPTQLNAIQTALPTGNVSVDLGSQSNRFKTGWFSGVSGFNGVFQNVTVLGTLNATIPASTLNNSTGNNVTLSGTTNLNSANFSGDISSAGTNTFSGSLNVTGNSIFNGTITATGNKTFSGNFSQTGNSSFFGSFTQSGSLFSTGGWNHTGTFNQTGDASFKGNVSINATSAAFNFSGNSAKFNIISDFGVSGVTNITGSCSITGAQHAIAGDIIHTGSFNHSGSTVLIGETRNTGSFAVIGNSLFSGNAVFTGSAAITSGVSASGTSSAPALVLNRNLTTNASGGAIEYGSDGRFYFTNETTGSPNRTSLNPVYSYVSPLNYFFGNSWTGTTSLLLGVTGIYLNTGTYHINYNTRLDKGGTQRAIWMGITGNANNFTQRLGLVSKSVYAYTSFYENAFSRLITGDSSTSAVFQSGANATYTDGDLGIDSSVDSKFNKYFTFDCVVTITGLTKVQPFFRINPGETMPTPEAVTGSQFNMRVTQLTTGTGLGLSSASGPWSNV